MKLLSISLFRWNLEKPPMLLCSSFELNSFGYFQRSSVKELANFVGREVIERSKLGERQTVEHKEYLCHSHVLASAPASSDFSLAAAVIADSEYPSRVAFSFISKVLDEFLRQYSWSDIQKVERDTIMPMRGLDELLQKYQEPQKADPTAKIQKDLDETKEIIVKTIDQLLLRGEKLEVLAEKSQDLSFQSKAFLKQSEKLNSCCIIL